MTSRVGIGYDAHRFGGDRGLVIGGVEIADATGLVGHSDADVLAHAVTDAVLGACGLGDIGRHFPDKPEYAGADSVALLGNVRSLLEQHGWRVSSVDSTIVCEAPRLQPFIAAMGERLARALQVDPSNVSVKATTSDGMGFTGRGEGIAAMAVALVERG
jgi:2-C-methyl-D-erythritol 2,4-cyclodiphosphate synthase